MGACRSRTNADDRLPLASLGPVEGGDGIVEGRDVADVRPQSSVTHPLDDLTQLGAIGLENQIDSADVFEYVVLEGDELLRAEVERLLTVGRASGADDVGAELTCELRHHRPDCAGRAVREDDLPRLKAPLLAEPLPSCQA